MKKAAQRVDNAVDVLDYYATNQWDFDSEIQNLFKSRLNDLEEDKYKVSSKGINLRKIISESCHGLRLYVDKSSDDSLPSAFKTIRM